jgi:hypothetical protein
VNLEKARSWHMERTRGDYLDKMGSELPLGPQRATLDGGGDDAATPRSWVQCPYCFPTRI